MRVLTIASVVLISLLVTSSARDRRRKGRKHSSSDKEQNKLLNKNSESSYGSFDDRNVLLQRNPKRKFAKRKSKHHGERPRLSDGISKMLKSYRKSIRRKLSRRLRMHDHVYKKEQIRKLMGERKNDETELKPNADVAESLLEGDIVPTEKQIQILMERAGGGTRKKRKAISGDEFRWPTTIKYAFDGQSEYNQARIKKALKIWQSGTCIDFKEFGSLQSDGILFIEGEGCYSNVGKVEEGTEQVLSIGSACYRLGIVAHEIGHALGLWHEQGRPDRDRFVTVDFDEVLPDYIDNFEKRPAGDIVDSGVDYDYGSVMHYSAGAFSKTLDGITIRTNQREYQNTIGQRSEGPTFLDIKAINLIYCSESCKKPLACKHRGYPDPRDCSNCKCPRGTGGKLCDKAENSLRNCGGELKGSAEWQTVSYGTRWAEQYCVWRIQAETGQSIVLEIIKLNHEERDTCTSFLEVKTDNFHQTGARFCQKQKKYAPIKSIGNEMIVIHKGSILTLNLSEKLEFRFRIDDDYKTTAKPDPTITFHPTTYSTTPKPEVTEMKTTITFPPTTQTSATPKNTSTLKPTTTAEPPKPSTRKPELVPGKERGSTGSKEKRPGWQPLKPLVPTRFKPRGRPSRKGRKSKPGWKSWKRKFGRGVRD